MADPEQIGGYRILGLLGEGGMGRVYHARHATLDREVALKVLAPNVVGREDMGQRFLREAQAMAALRSPYVVGCYDAGRDGEQWYMALEFVTGGDAAQLLAKRGGHLAEGEALAVIADAARGLVALEAASLIHRDIKPANIFIAADGRAKLADLGLVRGGVTTDLTQAGAPLGTPSYMAPEQAEGRSDLDIRADIYALGASLWCLLFGAPPFTGEGPLQVLQQVMYATLPDPRDLRADLHPVTIDILGRSLARKRDQRFATAEDFAAACERARATVDEGVRPSAVPVRAASPAPSAQPGAQPGAQSETTAASPLPPAVATVTPTPRDLQSSPAFKELLRRVHVGKDGLSAWINLAPGAAFPMTLLGMVLEHAGIDHGLCPGATLAASRPQDAPRRIVLALGDA
ncbi:MAG: serine/threonine-protein kinase, partial [Planctomycetota bacterium]